MWHIFCNMAMSVDSYESTIDPQFTLAQEEADREIADQLGPIEPPLVGTKHRPYFNPKVDLVPGLNVVDPDHGYWTCLGICRILNPRNSHWTVANAIDALVEIPEFRYQVGMNMQHPQGHYGYTKEGLWLLWHDYRLLGKAHQVRVCKALEFIRKEVPFAKRPDLMLGVLCRYRDLDAIDALILGWQENALEELAS